MATQGTSEISSSSGWFEQAVSHRNAKIDVCKTLAIAAIVFSCVLTNVAQAAPPSTSLESETVVVETSGHVPGFTQRQLAVFLALKMHEETAAPWQFSAGQSGMVEAPNRVLWSFKTLRVEWKGGSHKGFPSPTQSVTHISAEVKLYLKNIYQMTMLTQPSVTGGSEDRVLSEMVHKVSHTLFVANQPDMPGR